MSDKLPDFTSAIALSDAWGRTDIVTTLQKSYGSVAQINALISYALLDYLSFVYQCESVECLHGVIGKKPFEGAQGIKLTSTIAGLNPVMAHNLEIFLDMVANDEPAQDRDINIFRDIHDGQDSRLIVYADPLAMMEYVHELYKREGILCDFTRQYLQTMEGLRPRHDASAFYLN